MTINLTGRHRAIVEAMRLFDYDHLPPHLQDHSKRFAQLAESLVTALPDDPVLTTALWRLWESKNCAVFLAARGPAGDSE